MAKRGRIALVLGRLIPGLRIPTTVMAGLSDLSYREYAQTCAVAAVIWSTVYFYLGRLLQHEAHFATAILADFLDDLSTPALYLWLLLVLTIGGGGLHLQRRATRHRHGLRARSRAEAERRTAEGQLRIRQPNTHSETHPPAAPRPR
jgi:membrane protein DedA with SNARE-associated domain